jgi:hypothetical protein
MSQANPFLEALKQARRDAETPLQGMSDLKQFSAAIEQFIGSDYARCSAVPGGNATVYGQEYKVILTFLPSAYTQTLLRAYLKSDAAPSLDVQDGKGPQKCKDIAEFKRRLQDFLKVKTVLATLETFRREATVLEATKE